MVKYLVRCSGLAALALALIALPAPRADEKEPGVQWENTVSMKTQGFSMPATTSKFCAPKSGLKEPPKSEKDDGRCKMTDVKTDGPKMTWKMVCAGKEPMTGEGEIVQGKDRFDGKVAMHSKQGDMEMVMAGKKLGGECDAGELKRQVAAMQKQSADAQAQMAENQAKTAQMMAEMCAKGSEEMAVDLFAGPSPTCKDKAKLCGPAVTRPGFGKLRKHGPQQLDSAAKLCGFDVEKTRARLCKAANDEVKAGGKTPPADALQFLPPSCPVEAQAVAKQECAGRSYTGMPSPWRGFCVAEREAGLSQGGEVTPAAAEDTGEEEKPKEKAIDKAKKSILKGLFGK
jgi:hypothetical protein